MQKTIPINEMFFTFQGEGSHIGKAAFFVRTQGCPLRCSFCDSAGTWHKNYVPENIQRLTAHEIADAVTLSGAEICVFTGGEPAVHDLEEVTHLLATSAYGRYVASHIETSGAFPIRGNFSHICVSPKLAHPPLSENVVKATELKVIVTKPSDIMDWEQRIDRQQDRMHRIGKGQMTWLHPEWSQRTNPDVLNAITNAVKKDPQRYRAGYQIHKLYRADSLDTRTQPLAPLGGNPDNGY